MKRQLHRYFRVKCRNRKGRRASTFTATMAGKAQMKRKEYSKLILTFSCNSSFFLPPKNDGCVCFHVGAEVYLVNFISIRDGHEAGIGWNGTKVFRNK